MKSYLFVPSKSQSLMRKLIGYALPLLLFASCSMVKAPMNGDFSRVKYNAHLHQGQVEASEDPEELDEKLDKVAPGPQAFQEKEVELSADPHRASNPEKEGRPEGKRAQAAENEEKSSRNGSSQRTPLEEEGGEHERARSNASKGVEFPFVPLPEKELLKENEKRAKASPMEVLSDALLWLLAFVLPPLAVYMATGKAGPAFWLNILLSLLVLPGIIHALIIVGQET